MSSFIGRPLKYGHLINQLHPDTLYTPASIAIWAKDHDYLQGETDRKRRLQYQRIRIALGRFSNNRKFPDEGDGMVTLRGQSGSGGDGKNLWIGMIEFSVSGTWF